MPIREYSNKQIIPSGIFLITIKINYWKRLQKS